MHLTETKFFVAPSKKPRQSDGFRGVAAHSLSHLNSAVRGGQRGGLTTHSLVQSVMNQRKGVGHLSDFLLDRREAGSATIRVLILNHTLFRLFQRETFAHSYFEIVSRFIALTRSSLYCVVHAEQSHGEQQDDQNRSPDQRVWRSVDMCFQW